MSGHDERSAVTRSTMWVGAGNVANLAIRFASNIILTRLLLPEVFGLSVLLNSIGVGLCLFMDTGIAEAALRNRRFDERGFQDTAWTLEAIRGVLIWGGGSCLAGPLAYLYGVEALSLLLPAFLAGYAIEGFKSTRPWAYRRQLRTGRLISFEVLRTLFQVAATIGFAFYQRDIWAIIWGSWVGNFSALALSYFLFSGERNRFCLEKESVKEIAWFSGWAMVGSPLYYLSENLFFLVIPILFSTALVGIFGIAFKLATIPLGVFSAVSQKVVYPVLIRHWQESGSERFFRDVLFLKAFMVIPVLLFLSLLASCSVEIVSILFNENYRSVANLLPPIAIAVALRSLGWSYIGAVLKTTGYVQRLVYFQALYVILLGGNCLIAYHLGSVDALLWGAVVVATIMGVAAYLLLKNWNATTPLVDLICGCGFLLCLAICHWISQQLEPAGVPVQLATKLGVCACFWGVVFLMIDRWYALNARGFVRFSGGVLS